MEEENHSKLAGRLDTATRLRNFACTVGILGKTAPVISFVSLQNASRLFTSICMHIPELY